MVTIKVGWLRLKLIKRIFRLPQFVGFGFLSVVLLCGVGCKPQSSTRALNIATAANMQFAMERLTEAFTLKTGIPCHVIVSSSGKLTAQVQSGAPFDVFVSADTIYPNYMNSQGYAAAPPQIYAYGKLVLWSLKDTDTRGLGLLLDPDISHIAIPNPETAPYGRAAVEVLQNSNLYDSVVSKLVYGESIAQVNQFVFSGAAGVGFTALAAVQGKKSGNVGYWQELPEHLYNPIAQAAVVLKHEGVNSTAALTFFNFLWSAEAQEILLEFGYKTPTQSDSIANPGSKISGNNG